MTLPPRGPFVALCFVAAFLCLKVPTSASNTARAFVEVPTLHSSSFLGLVSLSPDTFERDANGYKAAYKASVLGFIYREHGTVHIDIDDAALARLVPGTRVEFVGRAFANDGGTRRIKGYAETNDPASGIINITISVTKSIELSFSGPFRFKPSQTAALKQ